jgi:type 1 glutamine amidotransferase
MGPRITLVTLAAVLLCASLGAQQPAPRAGGAGAAPAQGAGAGGGRRGGGGAPQPANPNGMRVFIRAGLKSHGEGMHDYPQFLADWSKVLTDHGARVMGSLQFPSAVDLANTDVLVMYKGDAGYMTDEEKTNLDAYVKRGGGLVSFHDTLCGPDPDYFSTIVGGAKKHGETNFSAGQLKTTVVDKADPIMQGMSDFTIQDEAFMMMTWAKNPEIHVLGTVAMPGGAHAGEVVPQIWTYEHTVPGGQPSRAFVWMQGHTYKNFSEPAIQAMILRGISWAAKKPVDALSNVVARSGGRGPGGSDIVVPGAGETAPTTPAAPSTTGRGRGRGGD